MALAGLWHGANWTFIAWGIGWALLTAIWRLFGDTLKKLGPLEWALTLFLVMLLWVFFRAPDMTTAWLYLGTMFGTGGYGNAAVPNDGFGGLLVLAGCAALLGLQCVERHFFTREHTRLMLRLDGPFLRAFLIGIAITLVLLPKSGGNPFIYFRF